MTKRLLKFGIYLGIIFFSIVFYLAYFGIETKNFNNIIEEKILKTNPNLRVELKKIKIFLNLKDLSFNLTTIEPKLYLENNLISLEKISTNLSIDSYLKDTFAIKNIQLSSSEIDIKNLIKFARSYNNNAQLFILEKIIKNGSIKINFKAEFDANGTIKDNYTLSGLVENTNIKLLNKDKINNINFSFTVTKNQYYFEKINLKLKELDLNSKRFSLLKKKDVFFAEGEFENTKQKISLDVLALLIKNIDFNNLNINKLIFASKNLISFEIDKNLKFSNLKINSEIALDELFFKPKNLDFYKFEEQIKFKKNILNIDYNKKNWSLSGKGSYSLEKKFDDINYYISGDGKILKFKNSIHLNSVPVEIKQLYYKKNENSDAIINFEGEYKKNNFLKLKNFEYNENENFLKISNILLDQNFKIVSLDKFNLNYKNLNNKENNFLITKSKNNYKIVSDRFDASAFLEKFLNSDDNYKFSKTFQNLNSNIFLDFKKTFLSKNTRINALAGDIKFEKNNITNLSLNSKFFDNKELNLSIRTNDNGEKITTFYSGNATPIIGKYKFVKGFSEGSLDYYSIKINQTSKSKLTINNFKLQEVPVLTKILTLASLQGIADLLTGEGIRFDEFEMDFRTENKLMTIEEAHAIGPSISILMSGYVEKGKLVSLRGTLVPATTINKIIGKIKIIGDILIGSKKGEGVFGVSFKIKGPPKNLKTTVNPIKTLTPRFITRILEKAKKGN